MPLDTSDFTLCSDQYPMEHTQVLVVHKGALKKAVYYKDEDGKHVFTHFYGKGRGGVDLDPVEKWKYITV